MCILRKKVTCELTSTRNFAIRRFSVSVSAIVVGATPGSGSVEEEEEEESGRSRDSSDEKLSFFMR